MAEFLLRNIYLYQRHKSEFDQTTDIFQETLKELFDSWEAVKRHREVIIFTAGLMRDPRPLIHYVYEKLIEENLQWMRTGDHNPSMDEGLFKSLYKESTVPLPHHPLHNKHINYYNHVIDNDKKRSTDTTPVHIRSKLFVFEDMAENVNIDHKDQDTEPTECAMRITWPHPSVTVRTLSICHRISKHQVVSDLYMCHGCYSWSRVLQAICPPADGWRPASRGGLGATRTSVTFILFF